MVSSNPQSVTRQSTVYEVWLCDQYGQRLQLLDDLLSFEIVRVTNDVGYGTFTLPGDFDQLKLGLDHIVEVWRNPVGGNLTIENAFFLRKFEFEESAQGNDLIIVGGPDGVDLLTRRIVAYAAGSSQSYKVTQDNENVLLDIIDENLGSAATDSDRDITGIGFSIGSDPGGNITITKGFAWKPLIRPLQEIADWSAQQNYFVYFTIEPRITSGGNIGFEAIVRSGEIYSDHTYEENAPITFSKEWGNLSDPKLVYDYTKEVNYVYGGGAGEEDERTITETQEAGRVNASIWNRREAFVDSRNDPDDAINRNRERLREGEPKVRFTATLLDTPQFRYGLDWHFGDRVIVSYQGRQIECIVKVVNIKVDKDGSEQIKVKVESMLTSLAPGQPEGLP